MTLSLIQLLIILAIILLLFGGNKLPQITNNIAQSLKILKKELGSKNKKEDK